MRNGFHQLADVILDPAQRHCEPRAGQLGYCRAFAQPKSIDEARRTIDFVCSAGELDRYGELVLASAFAEDLDGFRANALLMAGHIYVAPDGRPTSIGTWPRIEVVNDRLEGTAQFMEGDELAELYWNRYRQGIQKAASVGFLTKSWTMQEMEIDGARQRVRVFDAVELVEISCTAIPACRSALVRAASAFGRAGLDVQTLAEPLRQANALGAGITRDDVERLFAKYLDTTPGGHMHMLVLDVVEHVLARSGLNVQDDYDDIPAPGSGESRDAPDDGGDDDINAMLRDAAAKLDR